MVIASIDLLGGKVVQLRQGASLVLQRDDPEELAAMFDRYGEVALIDLDAAMGNGSNQALVRSLLQRAECRVGGGIRSAAQARELVSLGARRIITGSSAFRNPDTKGMGEEFGINLPFLEELNRQIGRQRTIIAVDARRGASGEYELCVDGWKTLTGLNLLETAQMVEPYCGELLFTCVEREGGMEGTDLEILRTLRDRVSCGITIAGGVSTLEEIETIAKMGCNVQLGMALYTGRIDLADAFIRSLNWGKGAYEALDTGAGPSSALLPVIAQSSGGQVLMTGFTDSAALKETFTRDKLCFYSRSRNALWMKGETSGNTLDLVRLRADCDGDAILATVDNQGPVCHTGAYTCFSIDQRFTLETLQSVISERLKNPQPNSYTATLDDELVREKLLEEAEELCTAQTRDEKIYEAGDLLYFATVLLSREGIAIEEIVQELERRHKK